MQTDLSNVNDKLLHMSAHTYAYGVTVYTKECIL